MTTQFILTPPYTADDLKVVAALLGVTPGGGSIPPPGTDPNFPADPGLAPFPSPENSQVINVANVVSGRPYLKDRDGAVHTLRIGSGGIVQYFKNAQEFPVFPGETVAQLLVRQGGVYMQIGSGIWKQVAANGTMYNAALPTAGGTTPPGPPAMPPMPSPSVVAPGSSGRIVQCGSGQAIPTLTAAVLVAQEGDTIQVSPGTYTDTPKAWTVPLLIDLGGATFDATGKTGSLAYGKGLLVPAADSIIQNGTISGVAMDQASGQLTCAIRPDAGCGYLTIRNMRLRANQCAIGHGGFPIAITVEASDISGNGLLTNDGALTHNLYVGQECVLLTLTNVTSAAPTEAHAIKYRGHKMVVNGGTFAAENGSCFDRPNGSTVPDVITNATLFKSVNASDHKVINYAEEGTEAGLAGMRFTGGMITAECVNPTINGGGGTVTIDATTRLAGNPIIASGGVTLAHAL